MIMDVVLYRADNSGPIIAAEEKFRNRRFTVEHPDVRFWHIAESKRRPAMSAFGGKADMTRA
jgi:hypothetical protein